jgi:hypothetical protein
VQALREKHRHWRGLQTHSSPAIVAGVDTVATTSS